MKKEYDFSNGSRGKYYKKFQGKTNIVVLEEEVLKELIKLSKLVGQKSHR